MALPAVISIDPSDESARRHPDLIVIFLHGFSMSASDMAEEFVELFSKFKRIRFVFPEAPMIPITAHGGEMAHSWFDYISDHNGTREDVISLRTLRNQRFTLMNLIASEKQRYRDAPLLIGGLSQGGCMALDLATRLNNLVGVVTCVAHRLFISKSRPLLAPWYALTADQDEVFPKSWAAPSSRETALHTVVQSDHYLLGGEGPVFVSNVIEHILAEEAAQQQPDGQGEN